MTTYIVLLNFADQGICNIKEIPERIIASTATAERFGIKVKDLHWTMRAYDAVFVVDAPNSEVIKDWVDSLGKIRAQTIPTVSADKIKEILAKTGVRNLSSCEMIQWSY